MDVLALNAEQILRIKKPEKLFSRDRFNYEFKLLRSKWHPDKSNLDDTETVFKHVMDLAEAAKDRIEQDLWNGDAIIQFTTSKDKKFKFRYEKVHEFELGKMYIGSTTLMYVIDKEYGDLFDNGLHAIKSIHYPDVKFKEEFSRFLPKIKLGDKETSIGHVLVLEKTADCILLQDLISYEGTIEPRHVAWIVGSLYNTTTFLDFIGVAHNSILPTTVFIDPKNHATYLLGGWWYSTKVGDKLKALPAELLKVLPGKVVREKASKTLYDRQAVKGIAIACFGDPTMVGSRLLTNKDIPNAMLSWIRLPSGPNAIEEYNGWYQTLEKCFGKRKFVEYDINIDEIY